jgi:hypothetical protein
MFKFQNVHIFKNKKTNLNKKKEKQKGKNNNWTRKTENLPYTGKNPLTREPIGPAHLKEYALQGVCVTP